MDCGTPLRVLSALLRRMRSKGPIVGLHRMRTMMALGAVALLASTLAACQTPEYTPPPRLRTVQAAAPRPAPAPPRATPARAPRQLPGIRPFTREADFDNAFIFRYSKRKDTPAADMPHQLPEEVKEERNQRLLLLTNELGLKRYEALTGKRVQILVEGPSKRPERMMGRTRCNKIVVFDGNERHRAQLMDVQITRAGSFTLYGDPAVVGMD